MKYKILRWDATLCGKNVNPVPMIYIKPDQELLNFSKSNNNSILLKISDTNSIYDEKQIVGILGIPSSRPNFFKKTGWYIINLYSSWHGYPPQNGSIEISKGINEDLENDCSPIRNNDYRTMENYDNPPPKFSTQQLNFILFAICLLFFLLSCTSFKFPKNNY